MRAVVFDMDGTLLDSVPTVSRAYADAIRSLGCPPDSPDDVFAEWHTGLPKRALDGSLPAQRRLAVPAEATAYVGGAEVDLGCANAAGPFGVHFRWDTRPGVRGGLRLRPADRQIS